MNDGTETSQRMAEIGNHCRDAGMGAEELYGLGIRVARLVEAVKHDITPKATSREWSVDA